MRLVDPRLAANQHFHDDLKRFLEVPAEVLAAFTARNRSELRSIPKSEWQDLAESSGVTVGDVSAAAAVASFLFLRRFAERPADKELEAELREHAAELKVDAQAFDARIPALLDFFSPTEADEIAIAEEGAKSAIGAGFTDMHIQWNVRPAITSTNTVVAQHAMGQLQIHYVRDDGRHDSLVMEFNSEELQAMAAVLERAAEELKVLRATFDAKRWIT